MDLSNNQTPPAPPTPQPPEEKPAEKPKEAVYTPPKPKLSSSQKISVIALMLPLLALPVAIMLALSPVQLFKKAAENTVTPPFISPTPTPTPHPVCMGVQHCVKGGTTMFEYCGNCTGGGCRPGFTCSSAGYVCTTFAKTVFAFDALYPVDCSLLPVLTPTPTLAHPSISVPTPTPKLGPTATPTSIIRPICNSVCQMGSICPTGLNCINGRCRNSACSNRVDCACLTLTPIPTPFSCLAKGKRCLDNTMCCSRSCDTKSRVCK